jgi:hypothetical protein
MEFIWYHGNFFLKSNTRILKSKRLTSVWAFQFSKCPLAAYIRCCPFTLRPRQGKVDNWLLPGKTVKISGKG